MLQAKKQGKKKTQDIIKEEIGSVTEKELRVMRVKMIKRLRK